MLLVFVDETSDDKFKEYFGLSCVVINTNFYAQVKSAFQRILLRAGWDPKIEFKGSYLFSATMGCRDVKIEKRVEIASEILKLNTSNKNARMKFYYLKKNTTNPKGDYLKYLPPLLYKALPKAPKGKGKNILSLHCDHRSDITCGEVFDAVSDVIRGRGYTIFEDVCMRRSNFETVGILYADIVGYLSSRIDTIKNDSELFENIPPEEFENNGKIKKLRSSAELIRLIKKLDKYEVSVKDKQLEF
jgi:hypothetical protein